MAIQYALKVFEYEEHRPFRIIDRNGEPWFVLADVCRELGVANAADAARRLDDDEKGIDNVDTLGGNQRMATINESGLYSLILTSRKEGARRFKKWVTSEVLPSIRRTGGYGRRTPAFIRRYNANWNRVEREHFSVISELAIRLWGRFEQLGYILADKAADGTENRPDVSVGRLFSSWLRNTHPEISDDYSFYAHWTPDGEFPARQYHRKMLPLFLEYVDDVWIPEHAARYLNTRDPAALPYLPQLLPAPKRRNAA